MTALAGAAPRHEARTLTGPLALPALVALHLAPGALITLAFVVFAPVAQIVGYPPLAALLAAIALVLVPVELGAVIWAGRGQGSLLASVAYRQPISTGRWVWLVPLLILAAFIGFGAHQMIDPQLIDGLFGWLPAWFLAPIDFEMIGAHSEAAWIVTLGAYFALNGLLAPLVEELYFRGYLLPRMERLGRWAPLVNVSLFSLYHFWSPSQLVARILGFAPTVYAVHRTRNVRLGIVVHCALNSLSVLLVASAVLGRL